MNPRFYKYEKSEVDYTSKAMNPDEKCSKCTHYRAGRKCDLVRGDIDPGGWCKKFKRLQDKLREDYRKLKETRKYVEKREGLLKRFLNAVNKGDGHQ